MVPWLRIHLPEWRTQVRSLVGELRSHMLYHEPHLEKAHMLQRRPSAAKAKTNTQRNGRESKVVGAPWSCLLDTGLTVKDGRTKDGNRRPSDQCWLQGRCSSLHCRPRSVTVHLGHLCSLPAPIPSLLPTD